ncbi:MAG: nucleotide sugar dehydrogenase [Chthoniobacteraceae bacterium]
MNGPRITVAGLWHLGSVTAACCAQHFDVTALEFDESIIGKLQQGEAPVFEPGLNELIRAGLAKRSLRFTSDTHAACSDADVVWVTFDTPVNNDDEPDAGFVLDRIRQIVPAAKADALFLISSQMPAGTCRLLEAEFPGRRFACSPENLRLGHALKVFNEPERIVVGCRSEQDRTLLAELFRPFCANVIWMSPESAEMTKHALNAFLALSVTFANEIARLCELTGADAKEVEAGLKSDARIGQRAYLGPGAAFAGGTLARDVVALTQLAASRGEPITLIPAIKQSNDRHKGWALSRLKDELGGLRGVTVAVLGLTYKPGTDTLRRSQAVELCERLLAEGCEVRAFDPAAKQLPASLAAATMSPDPRSALADADAAVICTEWPEFKTLPWAELIAAMRRPLIFDANCFVKSSLPEMPALRYFSVGKTT